MKRVCIVTVGYTDYAVSTDDIASLLTICMRSPKVEHKDNYYGNPYIIAKDQSEFISGMMLADFDEDHKPDEPKTPVEQPIPDAPF